jgi:hypothetical protein
MTDRELLEAAAKAAGMNIEWQPCGWAHNNETGCEWNPLTDDGDALRLAVKLNIWPVRQYRRPAIVVQNGAAYFDELADEPIGDDPYAATRRAIVRAAAEIGKERT